MRSLFDSFQGCKVCEGSDFAYACSGCKLEGCLLTCESCLDSYGNVGQPAPFTVPAVGCYVEESQTQLRCRPFSLGSCDDRQMVRFANWSPLGFAWVASLLGLVLIATLTCLVMQHRRHNQLPQAKPGSSKRPATRVCRPVVPSQTCQTRLSSAIMSSLHALRPAPPPANTSHTLDSSSASQSALELMHNNKRRLPAAMADLEEVQLCKRANGEDWLLGSGSFGMVYKAKMGELDVAVKMIQKQHVNPQLTPQQALRVMQQELHVLETLPSDDNIVQFHGSYTQHGNILLVLEYMQGGNLRQALQGPLAASLTWYNKGAKLALDVIKGLHFLHCNRILHRDIKSGNILLSQHFASAKICDMGLAHIMTNTSLSSSTSSSGGQQVQTTLAYAAPELLLCLRCDEKADIFSYGVVVWELITQQPPRRGRLRELQVPEECPQAVSDLVSACLEQEAADRPTAQHIIHVIQTHIGQS